MAKSGFTLVELLVVLAIIGTLLSLVAPRYNGAIDKSNVSVLRQNLSAIRDTIDKMHGDTGKFPQTLDELVERKYLPHVPIDPLTGSANTWVLEQSASPDTPGIVDVHSGAAGSIHGGKAFKDM